VGASVVETVAEVVWSVNVSVPREVRLGLSGMGAPPAVSVPEMVTERTS